MPIVDATRWETYRNSAQKALERGDLVQAELQWLAAMEEAKDFSPDDTRYVLTFQGLAEVLCTQKKYSDAEPLIRNALQDCSEIDKKGTLMHSLAVVLEGQGRQLEAENAYQAGMELLTKRKNPGDPELIQLMERYANLLAKSHRQAEADHLRSCISGMKTGNWSQSNQEAELGRASAQAAPQPAAAPAASDNKTQVKREQGAFQRRIPVVIKAAEEGLPNNAWLAYGKFATESQTQGLYEVAENLWASALREANKFPPSDPRLMATLDGYGETLTFLQRYDEAEQHLKRSLDLKEKYLDRDDLSLTVTLNALAKLHYFKGNITESVPFGLRCLHLYERAYGDNHLTVATTAYNLAIIYHRQTQYDLAEEMYRKSWNIRRAVLGDNHEDTVKTMKNLTTLVLNRRSAEVEPVLDRRLNVGKISGTWKSLSIDEADKLVQ